MAAPSATGEKLPMFVIWKSKNPRCFKNVNHVPCEYKSQKKSWMNSEIFEEWVRKLDRKFRADDRKIALIIDNCPAHPSISNLTKRSNHIFAPKHNVHSSNDGPRCHTQP